MKRLHLTVTVFTMAVIFGACSAGNWASDDYYEDDYELGRRSSVNMDLFMRELSPFGQWVTVPRYGQVWVTNERGFRPYYSGGRWANTRYGYTWVSDYSWGWAPFHYGKWGYDNFYGWFWVPGYEWSPAWVNWRYNGSYYGWSPHLVNDPAMNPWIFSDQRYITDARFRDRCVFGDQQPDLFRNSQPISRPRTNTTTYRPQQSNEDIFRDNNRTIYREAPRNTNSFPRAETMDRPRFEIGKPERLDQPSSSPSQRQQQPQTQRPARDVIREQEQRPVKQLPQPQRPAEIKRENNNF